LVLVDDQGWKRPSQTRLNDTRGENVFATTASEQDESVQSKKKLTPAKVKKIRRKPLGHKVRKSPNIDRKTKVVNKSEQVRSLKGEDASLKKPFQGEGKTQGMAP